MIDKLKETDYNILVTNALNGAYAIQLREKYPNARIICAEVFSYFKTHLIEQGFEVIDYIELDKLLMRFDSGVYNPPYQDAENKAKNNKLWHKFIVRALADPNTSLIKPGGTLSIVTPSSVFNSSVGFGKTFKEKIMKGKSLLHANIHRDVKYFDVGVETCDWMVKNGMSEDEIPFPEYRDPMIDSIVNKIHSHNLKLKLIHENQSITKQNFNKGITEIYYSGKNKTMVDVPVINDSRLKIVFSFSSTYAKQFVTTEPTAHMNRVLYVTDMNHADNVMSYTTSKLFKFYANNYLKTSGFTPAVKNNQLPLLENKKWTDDLLYQYFNLTQEEIDLVNNTTK